MLRDEAQLLPISALQHLLFCERQCALIHIEQVWSDNEFTSEGNLLHERTHEGPDESRPGVRITRGMPVRSFELGLSGQCDVVEFHSDGGVLPVEYKRGKPKVHAADEVQLCAQALCLEEMLGRAVVRGMLYYGKRRRRTDVAFDAALRELTGDAARRLHALIESRVTPIAQREKKCESCSLLDICLPDALRFRKGAATWFARQLHEMSAP
ncbi:MAG: CRISPR-associated protein Cas4 [Chthoniobacterales bacterium]